MGYSASKVSKTDLKLLNSLLGEAMLDPGLSKRLLARPSRNQIIARLPLSPAALKSIVAAPGEFCELTEFADFVYQKVFPSMN